MSQYTKIVQLIWRTETASFNSIGVVFFFFFLTRTLFLGLVYSVVHPTASLVQRVYKYSVLSTGHQQPQP